MTLADGTRLCESMAILRFLGRKHGYYPQDAKTKYYVDMLLDQYNDLDNKLKDAFWTPKPKQAAVIGELF